MNSKHCKKRRNARKEMRRSRIDRETLERPSGIRKKKGRMRGDEGNLFGTYSTQNKRKNEKAIKF